MASLTAPIDFYTVKNTLGESKLDLISLCTSGRINPYAKFRPIDSGNMNPTESERLAGNTSWKRRDVASGWGANVTEIYPAYPRGGENSLYRLNDFIGYNHSAAALRIESIPNQISMGWDDLEVNFQYTVRLPECLPVQMMNRASGQVILSGRIYGTQHDPYKENIIGQINWTASECGRSITATGTMSKGLPTGQGITVNKDVYLFLSPGIPLDPNNEPLKNDYLQALFVNSVESMKHTIRVTRDYNPEPNMLDPEQGKTIIPTPLIVDENGSVITGTGITFDRWDYFSGSKMYPDQGHRNGNSAFKIVGLKMPVTPAGHKLIQYKENVTWKTYKRLDRTETFPGDLIAK